MLEKCIANLIKKQEERIAKFKLQGVARPLPIRKRHSPAPEESYATPGEIMSVIDQSVAKEASRPSNPADYCAGIDDESVVAQTVKFEEINHDVWCDIQHEAPDPVINTDDAEMVLSLLRQYSSDSEGLSVPPDHDATDIAGLLIELDALK